MKKLLLSGLMMLTVYIASAQDIPVNTPVIDLAEDTTQVITINDIISVQEVVSSSNSNKAHYSDVWSRNSFFNIGYNLGATMTPKPAIQLNENYVPNTASKFDNNWGAMIQLGHSYCVHKNPIANMVQINIDFSFIDLNFNQYDQTGKLNSSNDSNSQESDKSNTLPWLSKKYELSYGMSIGPSVTVVPLTSFNFPSYLHYIKVNAYYHFGYHASLLGMADYNKNNLNIDYLNLGTGFVNSYGINLSWKSIGIGWEARSANPKYKYIGSSNYSKESHKFKSTSSRIYITIKY